MKSCFIFQQIPITVIWLKADGEISPERSYQEHGVLTITNVQHSDSGVYICRAQSEEHSEQRITITVGGKHFMISSIFNVHTNVIVP